MKAIKILGSGCGFATVDRFCTSTVILADDRSYLLDCGEPAGSLLFRNGIDPMSIRAIFVSHMHPDHVGGLAQLLAVLSFSKRDDKNKFKEWSISRNDEWFQRVITFPGKNETVYSGEIIDLLVPSEGKLALKSYLEAVYLSPELLSFKLNWQNIEEGIIFRDDKIIVKSVTNPHLRVNAHYNNLNEMHPNVQHESYSFNININGTNVVYSGDIDKLSDLDPFIDNADYVIVEVAHYPPKDLKKYFLNRNIKKILLTHIHAGLEEKTREIVKNLNDPKFVIVQDGYMLKID